MLRFVILGSPAALLPTSKQSAWVLLRNAGEFGSVAAGAEAMLPYSRCIRTVNEKLQDFQVLSLGNV
jgi:hypothetical protein